MQIYNSYEDNAKRPRLGQIVSFEVRVPSATRGMLFDYRGEGRYKGESINGFYIEVTECSEPDRVGTSVSVRQCRADRAATAWANEGEFPHSLHIAHC